MGLDQLEQDFETYRLQGVKLYTAEWNGASRGYSLKDPFVAPYLEKCQRLGIRNIHIHKGPTTHPLDYDAYDVRDVCVVATDFPELNFIIDHCGMPRIDDFCFVAGAGAERLWRAGAGRLLHPRAAEIFRQHDERPVVLRRSRPAAVRLGLRHHQPEMDHREVHGVRVRRRDGAGSRHAADARREAQDHGAECGQALWRRRARRIRGCRE